MKFHLNGEIIDLIPVRAAHTGGDTMIRFENANVIMIGDFYRNYGYPFVGGDQRLRLRRAVHSPHATANLCLGAQRHRRPLRSDFVIFNSMK